MHALYAGRHRVEAVAEVLAAQGPQGCCTSFAVLIATLAMAAVAVGQDNPDRPRQCPAGQGRVTAYCQTQGTPAADNFRGGTDSESFFTGSGNDRVDSGDGDDFIDAGTGNALASGGDGNARGPGPPRQ